MARPLRIEFSGAIYHVSAHGNSGQNIFLSDDDRIKFLECLSQSVDQYRWLCYAYCLMPDHYHLLIETREPTLSEGMKYLHGSYTQWFNRKYQQPGHLFQGRFEAILIEREPHLSELSRYIVLNPVRLNLVRSARDWPWSSYRATAGQSKPVDALTVDWILEAFGSDVQNARKAYRAFVSSGRSQDAPWKHVKNRIYLGSDLFIRSTQRYISDDQSLRDIPKSQYLGPKIPLSHYETQYGLKIQAMAEAYRSGHFTLLQIGRHFKVSPATVSRAIRKSQGNGPKSRS